MTCDSKEVDALVKLIDDVKSVNAMRDTDAFEVLIKLVVSDRVNTLQEDMLRCVSDDRYDSICSEIRILQNIHNMITKDFKLDILEEDLIELRLELEGK